MSPLAPGPTGITRTTWDDGDRTFRHAARAPRRGRHQQPDPRLQRPVGCRRARSRGPRRGRCPPAGRGPSRSTRRAPASRCGRSTSVAGWSTSTCWPAPVPARLPARRRARQPRAVDGGGAGGGTRATADRRPRGREPLAPRRSGRAGAPGSPGRASGTPDRRLRELEPRGSRSRQRPARPTRPACGSRPWCCPPSSRPRRTTTRSGSRRRRRDALDLLLVGRATPEKGFQDVIDAVAGLPDVRITLCGEGPMLEELTRPRARPRRGARSARLRHRRGAGRTHGPVPPDGAAVPHHRPTGPSSSGGPSPRP